MSNIYEWVIREGLAMYLIDNYGIERYFLLYQYDGDDFVNIIKKVYKKEVDHIERDFVTEMKGG